MSYSHVADGCLGSDLDIARRAYAGGDLRHAFFHAAWALQDASADLQQALGLICEIYSRVPDESAIAPASIAYGDAIGLAVGRAWRRDFESAIQLAADALQVYPRALGPELVAQWVQASGRASRHTGVALHAAFGATIGWLHLRPAERWLAQRYVSLAHAVIAAPNADPPAVVMAGAVLRRAGDGDGALRAAHRLNSSGLESSDAWVQAGLAFRLLGRTDEAVAAFRRAHQIGGDPLTLSYECVRALCDAGRYPEALATLPTVVPAADNWEMSAMHRWFDEYRARARGTMAYALGDTPTSDSFRLAGCEFAVGWLTPHDASINAIRDPRMQGSSLQLHCTKMEAPSCRMVLAIVSTGTCDPRAASYAFSAVDTPDPRECDGPEVLNVWAYDARGPYAVNPPPDEGVRAAIRAVRAEPLNVAARWNAARRIGPTLGPSRVIELVGACSAPTTAARDGRAADEVFDQQLAAMFLLAHVDSGWSGSTRRRALLGVLHGTIDWVTLAAVIALREVALDEPDAGLEIRYELERLLARTPRNMANWLEDAIIASYARIPGVTSQDVDAVVGDLE